MSGNESNTSPQTWRVVVACDEVQPHTHVREVEVCRDLGGWFTSATGSVGLATPRAAVQTHAEECRWCVAEILAPGQSSRAEIAQENEVLRLDTERVWNALRHTARACTLPETDGTPARLPVAVAEILADLHATLDRLRAVVAALPPCHACDATATCLDARQLPVELPCCDEHAPTGSWTTVDLPYAAEVRAWKGTR